MLSFPIAGSGLRSHSKSSVLPTGALPIWNHHRRKDQECLHWTAGARGEARLALGVQFRMSMTSGTGLTIIFELPRTIVILSLNCWKYGDDGKPLNIYIQLLKDGDIYRRVQCNDVGHKRGSKPKTNRVFGIDQVMTRSLTIAQPESDPNALVESKP